MEDRKIRTLGRRGGATLLTIGLALGGFSMFAPVAGADSTNSNRDNAPGQNKDEGDTTTTTVAHGNGNYGTVKVREAGTDPEDVSNDPKVDCLEVAWYGFDETAASTITVTPVNPTPGAAEVFAIGDLVGVPGNQAGDAAGGSDDFDAVYQPSLSLTGVTAKKGYYHVNVLVVTTDTNGDNTKSKTVWVRNACDEQPPVDDASSYLQVAKVVNGNGPSSFPVTVDCGDDTATPASFDVSPNAPVTVTVDAPSATCTITETNAKNASSTTYAVGAAAATTGTSASDVAVDGTEAEPTVLTFTNTFTPGGGCQVDCGPPPSVPPVVVDIPTTTVPTPPTTVAPIVEDQVIVPTTVPTKVEGVQIVAPAAPAQVRPAQLARTGAMTDRLIVVAGLCLLLGGVVLAASKERTAVPARRR